MWTRLSKGASIATCFVLLFSTVMVFLPEIASAPAFRDETDTDFGDGEFTNTEVVGTGPGASVQLLKNLDNWIQLGPPPDPGQREGPAYCFDSLGGVMVIFGGYHLGNLNDTWEYDYLSNTWTEIVTDPTPEGREWGGMAYDSINEVCVLFGGIGDGGVRLTDTWEYDVATNTWSETTPGFSPEQMRSNPLVFDSTQGKIIMVGTDFATSVMQTWAYDASLDSWVFRTEGSPSPDRSGHVTAYDVSLQRTVLYGGIEAALPPTYHSDTWEYNYVSNTWTLRGSGFPPARSEAAMAYKSSENAIYMFGGSLDLTTYSSDTFRREGTSWTSVSTISSPPARSRAALVYDDVNDVILMCCGKDGSGMFNDTWVLGTGYTFMGFYGSRILDTGYSTANYSYLYINQSEGNWPANTEIQVRLATSNSPNPPWDFVGYDGTASTFYNQSKNAIPDFHDHYRYIRYSATLISYDGLYSPALEDIAITYTIDPSNPYLIETYPADSQMNVDPSTCVYLNFSEPMDRGTVEVKTYNLGPKVPTGITFDLTWSNSDANLELCPQTPFLESKVVQVFVNGSDLEGWPLIDNPDDEDIKNPFIFITSGEDPYIDSTSPYQGETDVANDTDVVITWSEPMDTASVTWTINQGFDPGGWTENWDPADTVLTLSHATPFHECDDLEFEVLTGKDKSGKDFIPTGAPNPWSFKILCLSPYVLSTDPYDGEANVEVNRAITVMFSEAMNSATLDHSITPIVTLTPSWPASDQLRVTHPNFQEGTTYTYCINDIEDLEGYHLLNRPYCINFMTYSENPTVVFTIPADGDIEVDPYEDVKIFFSEEMNQASVTWTLSPNVPDKVTWIEEWGILGQDLTLKHAEPMAYCSEYTFEVTGGTDLSGYPLIPGVVPNPWSFNTTFEFPCMMVTDPYDGETDVPLWKEVVITFDEPIDTTQPFVYDSWPTVAGTVWTATWSNGDRTVTLNHSKRFLPNVWVFVQVFEAYDLDGNSLKTGPVPNPFRFKTATDPNWPWIESTSPYNGEQDVPQNEPIVVLFSETMDTATVTWDVDDLDGPSSIVFTPTWSTTVSVDDTLTLNHVEPLRECQTYWVAIQGQDLDGNPLQDHPTDPSIANPWSFNTVCTPPVISSTDPADEEVNVLLDKSIVVVFSEEMQPGSLLWTIAPDPGGWTDSWSGGNTIVTLIHTNNFAQCTRYDIQVTRAWDMENNNIVPGPVPNPWYFISECINPYIVSADPSDGETDVPQDYDITVVFSEPMITGSVVFEIIPSVPFTESWSGETVLTISHDLFEECKSYEANITAGTDKDGNGLIDGPTDPVPRPWSFITACIPPNVTSTYPPNGGLDIPVDAPLIINFSEPMDTASVSITVEPSPGGWLAKEWGNNDMTLWWNHTNPYDQCWEVTVRIQSGWDLVGLDLVPLPYIWSFSVYCENPVIIRTDPYDGETDVELDRDIEIEFNDPMAWIAWTISPNPGGWAENWNPTDTIVVLSHSNPFKPCTNYQVHVTGGQDKDGFDLIDGPVPNPWMFRTVCIPPPKINWTIPTDWQTNVDLAQDIVISFDKEIVPGSFHWNLTMGDDPGGWSESWSQEVFPSDTVTLGHNDFNPLQNYCITIEHARDVLGQDFEGRPYELCFSTRPPGPPPPGGLTVTKTTVVHLEWNPVVGATHYNIYDSLNRFDPFPGSWNKNQITAATNTYDFDHLGDGLTHYYIVTAWDNGTALESLKSTMGVKTEKTFTFTPGRANIFWMSLPFVSEYTRASDITTELTELNIDVIGKWDRSRQEVVSYYYARGRWRGRDFPISAGDGIYVSAIASFNWDIVGTDSDASVSLPFSPSVVKPNRHWISVPYTGVYTHASDIVTDIEGSTGPGSNTYIVEIGLWDPLTMSERVYYYTPTGWTGDDFSISPGDGIYLGIVQSFVWDPDLVTPYVP